MAGSPSSRSWFRRSRPRSRPDVLELRVHGVSNTPPHAMLEVARADAEQVRGDALGSFWTLSAPAKAHARRVPDSHHDHLPRGVRREAYSWGQMARTTPDAPLGAVKTAWSAVSRAGWLLLLPLGLANAAYWSRAIPAAHQHGRGARSVRVFGLGLSLLLVTAVATVSLDLLATQCTGTTARADCLAVPGWAAWFDALGWSRRLVVASLVPLAALGFLNWLAAASRVRHESSTALTVEGPPPPLRGRRARARAAAAGEGGGPVLARSGLWSRWVLARTLARLHIAGGMALLVLVVAWSQVFTGAAACADPRRFFEDSRCWSPVDGVIADKQPFAVAVALSAVLLAVVVVLVATARAESMPAPAARTPRGLAAYRPAVLPRGTVRPARPQTTWWSGAALAAAIALFGAHAGLLWVAGAADPVEVEETVRLLGLVATPAVLVAILFGIALAALGWRRGPLSLAWIGLAVVTLVAFAAAVVGAWPGSGSGGEAWLVAAAALGGLVLLSRWPTGPQDVPSVPRRQQAWSGAAPGVFLLLSLGAAMILSGLLVVVAGDWINGPADAASLVVGTQQDGAVVIPATYVEFAVATLVVVVFVLGVVVTLLALTAARAWWSQPSAGIPPAAAGDLGPDGVAAARRDADVLQLAGRLTELARRVDVTGRVAAARRAAGLAHRGEFAAGLVAAGVAVAVTLTLFGAAPGSAGAVALPLGLAGGGAWAMALIWGALLVRVVTGSGDVGGRPIALLWDLMCFLPRSAHPFGPPCYAERAVPELAARMDGWLRGDDLPSRPDERTAAERAAVGRRRVVLSAHSLGAVLAAAALFTQDTAARDGGPDRTGRVALLTYGTQLRSYFGRFFPELLGPGALGTSGSGPVAVLGGDPWRREESTPPDDALPGLSDEVTLAHRLGGRAGAPPAWVNLWRRTDPLGFPVASFGPNVVDRGAEEIDTSAYVATVATHGGYPRTGAYRRAMREVLGRLR